MGDDERAQRVSEIGAPLEERVEIVLELRAAVELVVRLAAGVDEDGTPWELEEGRSALADVDEVDAHRG